MAKVQVLAVLTMDGCLSELESKKHSSGTSDTYGIEAIREKTYFKITPEYSISMLAKWRGQEDGVIYLAEATPRTADFINGMLRMRVVDEIILYTLPQIGGTGRHFFQSALPQEEWEVVEHKLFDGGVICTVYRTEWKPTVFIK